MNNEIIVRLPTENVDVAVNRLAELDRKTFILSRDIGVIDLRLHDRIGLTPKVQQDTQSS